MVGIFFKDRTMAQELEQILDLLREIRRANTANDESLNRLLSGLTAKVDSVERNAVSADLIKTYLQDITKSLDNKYRTTSDKFSDIEQALKTIFNSQDDHVKTQDMRQLFDVFAENLNNFYVEVRQQRALTSTIESKLSEISSNANDKEEIIRTISLIRSDFEAMNQAYRSAIDSLSADLKSIMSSILSLDQTAVNEEIQNQVGEMYKAIADVISFLKSIDRHEASLEKILLNTASAESLKLTQVAVDSIVNKTNQITDKLEELYDANASKEQFGELTTRVDSLSADTEEVKQALAEITKNIDTLPDISVLEDSLQSVYNKIKEIHEDLLATHVKGDVRELDMQLNKFSAELTTAKKIIMDVNDVLTEKLMRAVEEISFEQESYDIKNEVSKMLAMLPQKDDVDRLLENDEFNKNAMHSLMNKVDDVADILDTLPKHEEIESLNNNQLNLVENLQGVANKEDIESLANRADDIEKMIDKLNFDEEFENLYQKSSSIEKWLEESKVKENSQEILAKVEDKAEQKEVLNILKTTEEIVNNIEELSKNVDVKKVNRTVAEVYQLIEDLKNDFINTAEMHNDSVIVHLSELQKSIEYVLTGEEFENFVQDLKSFVDKVGEDINTTNNNYDEIHSYQKSILNKIAEINVSAIEESIKKQVVPIDEKLTTLSEYITNMKLSDPEFVKSEISEIKEILSNKKSNVSEMEEIRNEAINKIESYLNEIKVILDTANKPSNDDVSYKIRGIEEILNGYHSENENNLTNIILKLDDIRYLVDNMQEARKKDLRAAIADVTSVADSLKELIESFDKVPGADGAVAGFVSDNLGDIRESLEQLSANVESNIQAGFAYSSELLEEKTSVLLDFIKDTKHDSNDSSDMYERLAIADDKLSDIQQSLQWINSDFINHANNQSEMLLKELIPIKDMMHEFSATVNNNKDEVLKNAFDNLHDAVVDDLEEVTRYSKSTFDKLEATYQEVRDALSSTENNLRDFFLGDIDSVIIKVDELKDDIENIFGSLSLPSAKQMKEFKAFVESIDDFRKSQKEIVTEVVDEARNSISEQLSAQHEELKSLLSVAANNSEIISAIDNLKKAFQSKISDFEKNEDAIFDNIDSDNSNAESLNAALITDLKKDFEKCSEIIKNLSDDNPELSQVLKAIKDKMNNITVSSVKSRISRVEDFEDSDSDVDTDNEYRTTSFSEDIDKNEVSDIDSDSDSDVKTLVGTDNFDFIKAFDLLKDDIAKLNENVMKVLPQGLGLVKTPSATEIAGDGNELISSLHAKIDALAQTLNPKTWLEDAKSYAVGADYSALLEEINGKLDVLMLSDNSELVTELRNVLSQVSAKGKSADNSSNMEIQVMLTAINAKIDALTAASDATAIEEVKAAIGNLSVPRDKESAKLLNAINNKIDIIASVDNTGDFDDIKDVLDSIESKIGSGVSADIASEDTFGELREKLLSLETKVDIIAATDKADDIIETLAAIEDKISELSEIDSTEDYSKIKETLAAIEDKISSVKVDFNPDELNEIKETLNAVDKKIDVMAASEDSFDTIEEFDSVSASLRSIEAKVDAIAANDYIEEMEDISAALDSIENKIDVINASVDNGASVDELATVLESLESKIDSIASLNKASDIKDIKYTLLNVGEKIDSIGNLSDTDMAITGMLNELNSKIDELMIPSDESLINRKELKDIKALIMAQTDYIESLEKSNKTEAVKKCLKDLTVEVNNINSAANVKSIQKSIKEMKDALMGTVVSVFDQVSFVEESEEIKDFVEEKTDEINKNLAIVTDQLKQITNSTDEPDYTYTMQDIESDLAKMRLALNELQVNDKENHTVRLASILDNISKIGETVDSLQNSLSQDEVFGLRTQFDSINMDIRSLSDLTNQLIDRSNQSYDALNITFEDFGNTIKNQLSVKVDNVTKLLKKSNESDKVMRQALIYMGEWIDSASESMNKISENSAEIVDVKSALEELKQSLPQQTELLNSIGAKFDEQQERLAYFEKHINKISSIEERFEEQQERIDRLEMSLGKILSAVEEIDDSKVTRKIDKIDKQISKLSTNIEKLASYVD